MKRLKYRHLFYGKSLPLIISLFSTCLAVTSVTAINIIKSEWGYIYLAIGSVVFFLLILAVCYAVIHRLKPDEKKKIAEASPLKWKKLPDCMKKKFHIDKKSSLISSAVLIGLELIFFFFIMLIKGMETMLVGLEVALPVTLICLACCAVWEHIWANMDNTAIYTRIKVDHWFYGERTRGGRRKYIVFYLPDGKYVLETFGIPPQNIVVIKYKCFIRWDDDIRFI
ncbi:MAG: hypothetical protein NC340_02160 [Ruminococcus flavefaciens]|nr:hypothetical protein [Ruminococcus flavefaciens]MCM1228951.1 hypothetical protein [Ruminococcus flavefaciens]